jgi:hypothetical protein
MPTRRSNPLATPLANAPAVQVSLGMLSLLCIVATTLGCASAKVGGGLGPDGGAGDTVAGGKDTFGASDKNGGAPSDALYSPCDPFSNAGCPSDQKCSTLRNGSTLALGCGSKGNKGEEDLCTPIPTTGPQTGDDCGDGLACFSVATLSSVCHRICALTGPDTCPGSETCSLLVGTFTDSTGLAFCHATTPCQALGQTGCPADQACYYVDQKGSICASPGTAQPGSTCVHANDCAQGATCLTVNGIGTCFSFCSTASGGTPSCSAGATCTALGGASKETNLGTCP